MYDSIRVLLHIVFFFFSSRRRHTRLQGDWSSDVCSSDLGAARRIGITAKAREVRGVDRVVVKDGDAIGALLTRIGAHSSVLAWEERRVQIGRASCRERV